jgi:hypothetical protein
VASGAWGAKASVSPVGGHIQGNPAAPHKLVEYMSYTCSHCAHFEAETALPLRMGPVGGGQLSFEVRHLLRDPLDITIAMLTNCVPPVKFFPLHHKFLAQQDQWIALAQKLSEEQTKRWNEGQMPVRMRAIASDLKFYDIAAGAGLPARRPMPVSPMRRHFAASSPRPRKRRNWAQPARRPSCWMARCWRNMTGPDCSPS